jgi:phage baseplate assembly protein W
MTTTSSAISLPFSFDSTGKVSATTDMKKMWQDRIVLMTMTSLTERVMRPTYGTNVKLSALDNVESVDIFVQQEISTAFSFWFPTLSLTSVDAEVDPTDGYLYVTLSYKYGTSSTPETLSFKSGLFSRSGDAIVEVING